MDTITGDPQYPGRMVLRIDPWPYETKSIDFITKRRPQALVLPSVTTGMGGSRRIVGSVPSGRPEFHPVG
jgi:hypothetical protein